MEVQLSNHNTIANNRILHSRFFGLNVYGSKGNSIIGNNISNAQIAIALWAPDNILTRNTISNNDRAIEVWGEKYNKIYHNNFINNGVQAWIGQDITKWDNGYPSGGNYWSDYNGTDIFKGPNQDHPGGDGIGDTPYQIGGLATTEDRYPLMFPAGTVHPPANLTSELSGMGFGDVTLEWELPLNDGAGPNHVAQYEIYRGTNIYDPAGSGYQLVASLPNGTSSYIDAGKGHGDGDNHFYIVCAVDSWNKTACSENQAGKFVRPLSEGLNLVSIPLIQSDERMQSVLKTVPFDRTWTYDSTDQDWKSYVKSKPYFGEFRYVDHTVGFWINVTGDSNLTVAGVVPETTQISLKSGWNLVSFPSFQQGYQVADLKADVSADRVERFYPFWPPYYLRALEDFETLMPGYGYWVHIPQDTIWIPSSN
jgi:parallel beta-helix repeat protein